MQLRCIVACHNASGAPDFYPCTVEVSLEQYDEGEHYERAEEKARDSGYEGPMLAYDENDGPELLFRHYFPSQLAPIPEGAEP
jgi:hypothetical protein